jgi:hypothetical protein
MADLAGHRGRRLPHSVWIILITIGSLCAVLPAAYGIALLLASSGIFAPLNAWTDRIQHEVNVFISAAWLFANPFEKFMVLGSALS